MATILQNKKIHILLLFILFFLKAPFLSYKSSLNLAIAYTEIQESEKKIFKWFNKKAILIL